jgi:hypothetical protein
MHVSANAIPQHLVPLSQEFVNACVGLVQFDKEYPRHLYTDCTYASILEICGPADVIRYIDSLRCDRPMHRHHCAVS